MYKHVPEGAYVHHMPAGTLGGKRALDALEAAVSHLLWFQEKPGCSLRVVSMLNHWTSPQAIFH